MKGPEAVEICQEWFAYLERQKAKALRVQELAAMARNGQQAEAQRLRRQLDNSLVVYDGARLLPAVQFLVKYFSQTVPAKQGG